MDGCESEKAVGKPSSTVTLKQPRVVADNKNGTTRRSRTREVSSRYMSPTPSAANVPKRSPSPNARRPLSTSTTLLPKRAISAERKRPSTPPSPSPSKPVQDVAALMLLTPRKKMLYNIWSIIFDLLDSVRKKRSNLQQLKLKLKLYSVLVNQAGCLHEWASTESDQANSLTWAIKDLQAATLRVPVTEGTRGSLKSIKGAICSAVDVMKAMESSLYFIIPQVEGMNSLVRELANVAAREKAMLNECESIFGSIAALLVEEDSLRTHLLQKKQAWRGDQLSIFGN